MKFFVPYDGSPLAQAALERAGTLTENATVVVCTVIPDNADYARKKGWLDDEPFDSDEVEQRLTGAIRDVVPDADVRCLHVRPHINAGGIVTRIRDMAEDVEADVVFLGSENVGRIAAPVASIGSNVATRVPYDIYLVQTEPNED
jgi:nucleotide-binding universal stress UspA family protein